MDLQSLKTLQELCINLLAEKKEILWRRKDRSQFCDPNGVEWRDPKTFLISQFADELLKILSYDRTPPCDILCTFTQEHACLKNVKISYSSPYTDGLQVFSHHKLMSLHIDKLHVDICTLLKCIGNKSYESLQHLVLQSPGHDEFWPHDDDLAGQSVVETFSRFNYLKSVDIEYTNVTNTMLTILGKSLLHVENLDLSRNKKITDISPLKNCQKTLKSLSLGGLDDVTAESAMATLVTLTGLTYLDVSSVTMQFVDTWETYVPFSLGRKVFTASVLLEMPDVLPNLVYLDLSGRKVRNEQALSQFLEAHQSLQMLMLQGTDACHFKSLQDFRPRLTVGGNATLEQYAVVLKQWTRTEELKGMPFYRAKLLDVTNQLSKDLMMKDFPPCHDDQLVQAVLGVLTSRSSYRWSRIIERLQKDSGLLAISLLLEKRIVRHLEPDTRQHLLPFCNRALQQHHLSEAHKLAQKILQALEQQ